MYNIFLNVVAHVLLKRSYTKTYSVQTNDMCKCFNKTMKQEFHDTAVRKKIYSDLNDLQLDHDICLEHFNNERPYSGKYLYGETPTQTVYQVK